MTIDIDIKLDEPFAHDAGRWATLRIGGVEIFGAAVYDTDIYGKRTEEQARINLLHLFASRLQKVLDES